MFPLAALLPLIGPAIDKAISLIPDPNEREKAKAAAEKEIIASLTQADNNQVEVNKVEAASDNVFVAGWRPFIGWVCGSALAYHYVGTPIIASLAVMFFPSVVLPTIPMDNLFELVLALLGMSGLRTFEKIKAKK